MYIKNVKANQLPEGMLCDVFECWNALVKKDYLPSRDDLISQPTILKYLPNLVIVSIKFKPLDFKAQMVGSKVISSIGFNPAGTPTSEFNFTEDFGQRGQVLVDDKEPFFSATKLNWSIDKDVYCETLAIPLCEGGKTVNLALLVISFPNV